MPVPALVRTALSRSGQRSRERRRAGIRRALVAGTIGLLLVAPSAQSASAAKPPPPPPPAGTTLFLWSLRSQNNGVFEEISASTRMTGLHTDPAFWNGTTATYGGWRPGGLRVQRGNRAYDPDYQLTNSMSAGNLVDGPTPTPIFPADSSVGTWQHEFVSQPVATPFTLAGPVTFHFSSAQTGTPGAHNAGFVVRVYKIGADGTLTRVVNDSPSTEVVGGPVVKNWTATPTSTPFAKGDRIALFVGIDDAGGTMSDGMPPAGRPENLWIYTDGETAGASGDSWIQLAETTSFDEGLTFAGSTLYFGNASAGIDVGGAVDEKQMSTVAGTSPANAATGTVAGPVPLATQQWRVTPGGNAIEWYSSPLNAFTLSAQALISLWGSVAPLGSPINTGVVAELAAVDASGANPRVWGRAVLNGGYGGHFDGNVDWHQQMYGSLSGPDTAVSAGERLRLRVFLDDNYTWLFFPITAGYTASLHYDGNSEDFGLGDKSYLKLAQTVSTFSGPPPSPNVPGTGLLDDFNRSNETPVSQGGNWAPTGAHGGSGIPLSQSRLQSFAQPSYSYRVTPYYGGEVESWATITARPNQNHWLSLLICLQDAGSSGWDGYELRASVVSGPDLWELRKIENGGLGAPLASTNFEIAAGGTMLLRRSGAALQVWWKSPGGTWAQVLSANDPSYTWGMIGAGGFKTGSLDDFGGGSLLTLLDQYAPEVRYDLFEDYRADSAATITDNDPPGAGTMNTLWEVNGSTLASTESIPGLDDLDLDYLGLFYPPGGAAQGRAATVDDYVNEEDTHQADAQRMHLNPAYADKIYGRMVAEPGGGTTLQYWFFYYFNWHPLPTGAGDHEGDWEMIQVELDSHGVPVETAYAQHNDGETCPWPLVEKTGVGQPVVYVAKGSHSSYYSSGTKWRYADEAGGEIPIKPEVDEIDPPGPAWLDWPGRWGDKATGAPVGPAQKGAKWLTPRTWSAGLGDSCFPESAHGRAIVEGRAREEQQAIPPRPPTPSVVATRRGSRVEVRYSFSTWPSNPDRRPVVLLTAVQSADPRYTPFTKRHRISTRRGLVTQPLGLGKAPFKLHAASYSRLGRSSKTVTVRVRSG